MRNFAGICCVVLLPLVLAQRPPRGPPPETPPEPPPGFNECKSKTGASDSDVQNFFESGVLNTTTGACFVACMKKKMGMINPDNTFNLNNVLEMLKWMKEHPPPNPPPNALDDLKKVETMFNTCKKNEQVVSDECVAAKNLMQCFADQMKALGISRMPPLPPPNTTPRPL